MTAVVIGAAWAVAVAAVLGARHPRPRPLHDERRTDDGGDLWRHLDGGDRRRDLDGGGDRWRHLDGGDRRRDLDGGGAGWLARGRAGRRSFDLAARRGDGATKIAGRVGGALRRTAGLPPEPAADQRTGLALVAALLLAGISPVLAVLPPLAATVAPSLSARAADRRRHAAVVDQVPDLVDLLTITATAGLTVGAALRVLGPRAGGALGPPLSRAASTLARGGTVADTLAGLAAAGGPALGPLVDALVEHDRYGTPLQPALDRVGIEARLRRRRDAEEAARRLPVTLLFPLVLTTLPAFALLTVVPLLAGSLGSLSL